MTTFNLFEEILISREDPDIQKFEQEIASIYATLADGQERLGREFEDVWDENIEQLYESWAHAWNLMLILFANDSTLQATR